MDNWGIKSWDVSCDNKSSWIDILLGLDWFYLTCAGIFSKTREITFPEKGLMNESNREFCISVFISEQTD